MIKPTWVQGGVPDRKPHGRLTRGRRARRDFARAAYGRSARPPRPRARRPDFADKIGRFQARANTVLDASASGAERLQAYQDVFAMAVKGDLLGMSDDDRALYDAATSKSDIGQRAYQLRESYIAAVNAAAQRGGAAAGSRPVWRPSTASRPPTSRSSSRPGSTRRTKRAPSPYASVDAWRDNMNAQLQVASYLRPDGVYDPNIAAKKAQDPKFAEVAALASDRNNRSAAWTQRALSLFGGQAPRDRVDLSDAARATAAATAATAAPAATPYRTGSIVSTVA